jgi:hypothetical protein
MAESDAGAQNGNMRHIGRLLIHTERLDVLSSLSPTKRYVS